jgi:small subunit ribosomal protein S10
MSKQMFRIKLESYDPRLLDQSTEQLVSVIKDLKAPMSGPIPLPTNKKVFTVKKSPHVYKESNEQFQICVHKRLIDIFPNSHKVVDTLSKVVLQSGVNISVKI